MLAEHSTECSQHLIFGDGNSLYLPQLKFVLEITCLLRISDAEQTCNF